MAKHDRTRRYVAPPDPGPGPGLLDVLTARGGHRFVPMLITDEVYPAIDRRPRAVAAHAHDVHHLVLWVAGRGRCVIAGRRFETRRGTLALVSPETQHHFGQQLREAQRYRSLTFRLEGDGRGPASDLSAYLGALLGCPSPADGVVPLEEAACARLEGALEKALVLGLAGAPRHRLYAAMLEVFMIVAEAVAGEAAPAPPGTDPGLDRARRLLEAGFDRPLRVRDLAVEAGMSPGHFHRRFKAAYGDTPKARQLSLRLCAARNLLRDTALPVGAVGAAVGFDDPYAFSRAFRKGCGCSPSVYRSGG